jgi:hypothetical protein
LLRRRYRCLYAQCRSPNIIGRHIGSIGLAVWFDAGANTSMLSGMMKTRSNVKDRIAYNYAVQH